VRYAFFKRCAVFSAAAALLTVTLGVPAQEAAPAAPAAAPRSPGGAVPRAPGSPAPRPGAARARAAAGSPGQPALPRPRPIAPQNAFQSPHGSKNKAAEPRVGPATDLPGGEIEVRLTAKELANIENKEVVLSISKQSIERGNTDTTLTARTDSRGVARFPAQGTATDFVYKVNVAVDAASYGTHQFQFRVADSGLRVVIPIFPATNELQGLLILSRSAIAVVPQDDLFSVDVMWRIENFGETSWLPENVVFPLPDEFRGLTVRASEGNVRFEPDGDRGVRLAGTVSPGQHDLAFRFLLPTGGQKERNFSFPTSLNVGSMRVILDSSPTMNLKVKDFPEPDETRNKDGQRRLVATRDFLSEKVRAPEKVEVQISGIPTPAAGRSVAVGLAAAIALAGVAQSFGRRRSANPARSQLSKEDLARASELLLEELISLEQAFQQGSIGRKTHEQARRQLLEAFARLGAERDERS
jgi:hypothetical protein